MAPPKTMVLSQQQQTIGQQQNDQQAAKHQGKTRKRKSKQPQSQAIVNNQVDNHQTTQNGCLPQQKVDNDKKNSEVVKENIAQTKLNTEKLAPVVVPSERTTIKKQQLVEKKSDVDSKREAPLSSLIATNTNVEISKHHQLTNEEADDIDAGIELDGSSNSGSSVKDINEDQIKSNSVSPVMAQSNLVSDHCVVNAQTISVVPRQAPSTETNPCAAVCSAKKISTTKQQLAANQQVIDADEQLLQEKLQIKKKKSLQDKNIVQSKDNDSDKKISDKTISNKNDRAPPPLRRRFSSQSSQESQDGSVCKVCEQHVYQMERMMAEKSVYHKKCFRCHQCKIQLRVDNYSSHEGQVYCKAHHRQIFQPQVKLDAENDVDIVAKSTSKPVDDYLLHRGRLSELSFSFLQPKLEGIQKRQMIICENEPAELPKDVIRSDTKLDDGIDQMNLNLNNILEKFERGTATSEEDSLPSSPSVVIEKPSFNIKQTLMAFESRMANGQTNNESKDRVDKERPVVKKLTNLNGFFKNSVDTDETISSPPVKPLPVQRSGSLMLRLKKYESRIAGEQVDDDEDESEEDENNNKNSGSISDLSDGDEGVVSESIRRAKSGKQARMPKKLTSIDLSSLKNQWESGDISKRRTANGDDGDEVNSKATGDNECNGKLEKNEELYRIRQQLAQKKLGKSGSVKNIYENAIKEAHLQASRRESSDLSALNGFSKTVEIQQQLLQNSMKGSSMTSQNTKMPYTPLQDKDHFRLNLSNKANKLKERFELGLINNSSHDDSDPSDSDETPVMTKLEQIRQEKLEDLSVFTDGEIKAREARSLFQQIDRRISAASGDKQSVLPNSRSLASISASMRSKLTNQMKANNLASSTTVPSPANPSSSNQQQQPIRLTNNVRT